jgi:hypothetical protein
MITPKNSPRKSTDEDNFLEDEGLYTLSTSSATINDPFDDEQDEFDLPLDDLDGLENFDADEEDDY